MFCPDEVITDSWVFSYSHVTNFVLPITLRPFVSDEETSGRQVTRNAKEGSNLLRNSRAWFVHEAQRSIESGQQRGGCQVPWRCYCCTATLWTPTRPSWMKVGHSDPPPGCRNLQLWREWIHCIDSVLFFNHRIPRETRGLNHYCVFDIQHWTRQPHFKRVAEIAYIGR